VILTSVLITTTDMMLPTMHVEDEDEDVDRETPTSGLGIGGGGRGPVRAAAVRPPATGVVRGLCAAPP
jgi:hypothetical protein